jgi:preprotein translocase subunit SecY
VSGKQPPAFATWLLTRFAEGNDALVGDLFEEYHRGRSGAWYWRQVLASVGLSLSKVALLLAGVVALFLAGSRFSVPGVQADTLRLAATRAPEATGFGLLNILNGNHLAGVTLFALGIMPYVTAALIVQVLAFGWRLLVRHSMRRDVPVVLITWCVALLLSAVQAIALAVFLERADAANGGLGLVTTPGVMFRLTTLVTLTASTASLMFISDQISRRRLGNGMFLVFVAGMVAGLAAAFMPLVTGQIDPVAVLRTIVLNTAIVGVVSHGYRRALVPASA